MNCLPIEIVQRLLKVNESCNSCNPSIIKSSILTLSENIQSRAESQDLAHESILIQIWTCLLVTSFNIWSTWSSHPH